MRATPVLERRRQGVPLGECDAAVDGRPAHDLRVHEVTRRRAHLPDAPIRLRPLRNRRLDKCAQKGPVLRGIDTAFLAPAPRELQHQAEHIGLVLLGCGVADAYRARAAPALERAQLDLGESALAVHTVDDLQVVGVAGGAALDEAPEAVRLALQSELGERMHGQH